MVERGRVEILLVDSECLEGNALGDPTRREVPVYLPPGYDAHDGRAYPTLYCLAGYTGFGYGMLGRGAWSEALDQRMDRLIAEGCPPALVVMPDCFTRLGGSQYMNSSATGRYEDHLVQEVVAAVDGRYRTLAHRDSRGVLGKSSGGYGALRMGMLHADVFGALACHSGDMYFEWSYQPDFSRLLNTLGRTGGIPEFLEDFHSRVKLGSDQILSLSVLAMAAAYSPNPDNPPLGVDLPFDLHSGEMRPEVWRRWKANDPIEMVSHHVEALQSLRLLFVDCGCRDEYNLHYGARIFVQRCSELGIPVVHEEFDDDHRGLNYRYDVSVPRLLGALVRE